MRARVGTASWTDKSLIDVGTFYPKEAKTPDARLRYYASQFPIVEVDASYYALPSAANAAKWVERTPEDFEFHVKAFRAFTLHQVPKSAMPADLRAAVSHIEKPNVYWKDLPDEVRSELWRRFRSGIEPLRAAGKLRTVHFQFAPWVFFGADSLQHIQACADALRGLLLTVEFRNTTWFAGKHAPDTLAFERDHGLVHTVVDAPQGFKNTVPQVWEVTNPALAVVRLHGRNAETWNAKGDKASDRFNYDYADSELEQMAAEIESRLAGAEDVHVIMNNNYGDQAVRNGASLAAMLRSGH